MTDDKKMIPMDSTMREEAEGKPFVNQPRNTYAMDQLINEVETLFPGVIYTVSNRSPRGVAFSVLFSPYAEEEHHTMRDLLTLIEGDERVDSVIADVEGVLVTFRTHPALMDLNDPFDLSAAAAVRDEGSL